MRVAIFLPVLLFSQSAMADDDLSIGRLFAPAGMGPASQATANRLRLDGAVARSTGKNTIWLNGQAHTEASALPRAPRTNPAQLPIVTLTGNQSLRVGETLDMESGERQDLLPGTAVIKRR